MRPHAAAPTEVTRSGSSGSARDVLASTAICTTCAKHEFAVDGLTRALANLRRRTATLSDENVDLRAELSSLYARQTTASR